jgi:hypothetical protein
MRLPRADIEKLHQFGDDAIACSAIEVAHAREHIEVGQQDVVADRLIHNETERALAWYHADAGGNRVARTCESALVTPDFDHRGLARGAEQSADHPIGAAAEEAG